MFGCSQIQRQILMRGKANNLHGLQMVIWRNDRPLFMPIRGEKRYENIAAVALKIENLTG